ncbi:MMPL family transporter [Agarivorans sp. B2Z047]|uniref:efflux RND transporter permease subunit n=1 Tax=Agarivorans sp. B2Z047 TaxID=2652721 RepID=UPI00128BD0E5|nr:MMPL family transporter [Agarivorans sp. B2Z047]MPW27912.1 MMPL family transporter [Agarivorans sp. B2Z047]UQN44252.1 MMPL family transporter [Agarivorans sp. B2Z047]
MEKKFFNQVIARPWLTLMLLMLAVVAMSSGGRFLTFVGDYRIFFGEDNPQLQEFESMQKVFNKTDSVTFVISPNEGDVFNPQSLTLIKELTDDSWLIPNSTRVDSITNFQHTEAVEDDLWVEDLLLELDMLDAEKVSKIEQVSLSEQLLENRLISLDGRVAVVAATITISEDDMQAEVPKTSQFVRELQAKYQQAYPEHKILLSGMIMMNNSFIEQSQKDMSTLVPLMFLLILVMLAILLRSVLGMLATLVVIVVTIASTMGMAGWMGFALNTVTVNVPTMVMTLAVADCVHVIASMLYEMRQGKTKKEALAFSLKINNRAIFLTSATTAIGFLTLNFSDSPPFQALGTIVAVGVMLAYVYALTILPALLNILPIKQTPSISSRSNYDRLANFVIDSRKWLMPVTLVVIVGFLAMIPRNQLNDVATEYFSKQVDFRQSTDFMEENISGITTISYEIRSGESSGINQPHYMQKVADFSAWLRQQPEIDNVNSISDIMRRLNKNMHGDDPSYYLVPEERELSAQYLLMYEMSLPYGLDLNNQINVDKSATRLTITTKNMGSIGMIALEQRSLDWWQQNAPEYRVIAASPNLMFAHIGERNMPQALKGAFWALVLISVLIGISLRSLRLTFISLLPNLVPAGIGFGIWALIDGNINLGLSIVISVTLGIVVDDTVHFLTKYQYARKQGKSAEDAVRYAFVTVGKALAITTAVLVVGFSVLIGSTFTINSNMGLLTSIIIAVALIIDFLLLPLLLISFDRAKGAENAAALQQKTA